MYADLKDVRANQPTEVVDVTMNDDDGLFHVEFEEDLKANKFYYVIVRGTNCGGNVSEFSSLSRRFLTRMLLRFI